MIEFLIIQVQLGRITVDQVPEKYREAVTARLQNQ